MRVMAQMAMVMNLDKCIGCHTCSVTCKQAWTNRAGTEYVWFNNVETRPGLGYPRTYEDQEEWQGGWVRKPNGRLELKSGGRLKKLFNIRAGWQPSDDRLPERMLRESPSNDSAARLTAEQAVAVSGFFIPPSGEERGGVRSDEVQARDRVGCRDPERGFGPLGDDADAEVICIGSGEQFRQLVGALVQGSIKGDSLLEEGAVEPSPNHFGFQLISAPVGHPAEVAG